MGKELFAKGIHKKSKRHKRPLCSINCAGNKSDIEALEVALFGSVKGHFPSPKTGPEFLKKRMGQRSSSIMSRDLTPACQAPTLENPGEKKGATPRQRGKNPRQREVDCSEQNNLAELCQNGLFSVDLYYKLKGLDLEIPPLRSGKKTLPPWCFTFSENRAKTRALPSAFPKRRFTILRDTTGHTMPTKSNR